MPTLVSRSRGRRAMNEINMVPFIDVMLVLLIIFMVTAPLISPSQIDLPSVGKAKAQEQSVVQIIIGKDEKLKLKVLPVGGEQSGLALDAVAAQVRTAQGSKADMPVVIAADKSVKYETVVAVMRRLQDAGIQRVGLSVQLAP
jgi:biopolymer transport protein TolR